MPAPCICEQAGGVLCPGPDKWPRRVGSDENERGRGQARPGGLPSRSQLKLKFFFFSATLKIGILMYKRSHVPFSWMIKAVMCPSQLHFMTATSPSRIRGRLISAQPKWRMSDCKLLSRAVANITIFINCNYFSHSRLFFVFVIIFRIRA